MERTRPTHGSDRRADTRVQRSLLVAGTALFLVGLVVLSGEFGTGIVADGVTGDGDVGDALADSPGDRDGGTGTPSPESDSGATDPDAETDTTLTAAGTATPTEEPTATPSPTEGDDSVLGGIFDWSTPTPTSTPE